MKIVKNKSGNLFLMLGVEDSWLLKKNYVGKPTGATIDLGDLKELVEKVPTPILEDIFFLAQAELQERDRAEIEKGVRYE